MGDGKKEFDDDALAEELFVDLDSMFKDSEENISDDEDYDQNFSASGVNADFGSLDLNDLYDEDEFTDDSDNHDSDDEKDVDGVLADDTAYDEILDLHSDKTKVGVDAKYPYIKVCGLRIAEEVIGISNRVKRLEPEYSDRSDNLDIAIEVKGTEYAVGRLPLCFETIMSLLSIRRYELRLVNGKDSETTLTTDLLKALIYA